MSQRRFGPMAADHPSVGVECQACHVPFAEGDCTTLVVLGPGGDPEAQQRRDQGRAYTAVALQIHWDCSEQLDDTDAALAAFGHHRPQEERAP